MQSPPDARSPASASPVAETMTDTGLSPGEGRRRRYASDLSFAAGDHVGRYVVLARVGEGGMGVVYAAYDPELDRKVALKVLRPEVVAHEADTRGGQRLLREARAMAKLGHPNVVSIHDVGVHTPDDSDTQIVFLAMEFVDGLTLGEWLDERARTWPEVVDVLLRAGRGLAAAHAASLVHRDFKPDNVMVDRDPQGAHGCRVRVMDFGLARVGDGSEPPSARPSDAPAHEMDTTDGAALTRDGAVLGTPAYMAPEQHLGKPADARTDQFSFCVTAYEALYRQRPFHGESLAALSWAVTQGQMRPEPKGSRVPARLRRVIARGLAKEPGDRFAGMDALLQALESARDAGRRFGVAFGIGAIALLAGLGGISLADAEPDATCRGAERKLIDVWDEPRRTDVQRAMHATGLPYADDTATRVAARLDDYTDAWVAAHVDACEATAVRHEQSAELLDLRMACLDRRLQSVAAAVDVLREADARVTANAVRVVDNLDPIAACADPDLLLAGVAPPDDPATRDAVAVARADLARVVALTDAGHYDEGHALASRVDERARELAYRPLQAEAAFQLGQTLHRLGRNPEAEPVLARAVFTGRASGHDTNTAAATVLLVLVVGADPARYDDAMLWARHAEAEVERTARGTKLAAFLVDNIGRVEWGRARYAEAAERHRAAIVLLESLLGPDDVTLAVPVNNAGAALHHLGDFEGARVHYERALRIAEQALGEQHPAAAAALSNLALVAGDRGDFETAARMHERALVLKREVLGSDHPSVASSLKGLASVLAKTGNVDEALEHAREALRIQRARLGNDAAPAAHTLNEIGRMLERIGRTDEAIAAHQEALAIAGPDSTDAADSHDDLGLALASAGRAREAIAHHRRALAIREATQGLHHPHVAYSKVGLGRSLVDAGRPGEAIVVLEEALALRLDRHTDPIALAESRFALAQALSVQPRHRARARELAEEARATFGSTRGYDRELAQIDALLERIRS